ncbi:MAG: hypothetical protein QGI02_06330 [Vicinamibacterales bacterium]|jgi:hypothetical protein|nr:hypothetical protein [Vicinamibacterales bacterium]
MMLKKPGPSLGRPLFVIALAIALTAPVSAQERKFYPDDPLRVDRDTLDTPEPAEIELSDMYDRFGHIFAELGTAQPVEAANANTVDEVPDSSWFTNRLLNRVGRTNGLFRVTASKYLPGLPIGPFRYFGTRSDDPNDIVPHEHRRELRGLRVFAAWLNHDDTRAHNTQDAWVEEDGRHYIRHYMMNPLDGFAVSDGALTFANLSEFNGYAEPGASYQVAWSIHDDGDQSVTPVAASTTHEDPSVPIPSVAGIGGERFLVVVIRTEHPEHSAWREPVTVYLRGTDAGLTVVGIDRVSAPLAPME